MIVQEENSSTCSRNLVVSHDERHRTCKSPYHEEMVYPMPWHGVNSGVSLGYIYKRRQGIYARPSQGMG